MSHFWRTVTLASIAAAALWLAGLRLISVVYSPLGLLFCVLIVAIYAGVGAAAATPPHLGSGAGAGALAGTGAALITVVGLAITDQASHAQSWSAWFKSLAFLLVTQLILGAVVGGGAALVARHRLPESRSGASDA